MNRVIDMELSMPHSEANPDLERISRGRPGTPFAQSLPRPEATASPITTRSSRPRPRVRTKAMAGWRSSSRTWTRAGIERGLLVGAENSATGKIHSAHPGRFFTFVTLDPNDGMRAVREFERLVKEEGANGLRLSALYNGVPANDRRYYPLYAKAAELDVPVRIYTSMNYANDRPYDLGHPRYLDDVASTSPSCGSSPAWPAGPGSTTWSACCAAIPPLCRHGRASSALLRAKAPAGSSSCSSATRCCRTRSWSACRAICSGHRSRADRRIQEAATQGQGDRKVAVRQCRHLLPSER
jgi:hypothetical protein